MGGDMNRKHGGISHLADILCFINTQNVHSIEPSQTCVLPVTRAQAGEFLLCLFYVYFILVYIFCS